MRARDVIDLLLAHYGVQEVARRTDSVDTIKCGDPDQVVTGICVTGVPTIDVIQTAIRQRCNMIICHEPLFYNHRDEQAGLSASPVFQEKMRLLSEHQILVWRYHDSIHSQTPDGIYEGVARGLGWHDFQHEPFAHNNDCYRIPKTTVGELARFIKDKMNLRHLRLIGDPDSSCETVAMVCGGGSLNFDDKRLLALFLEKNIDVLLLGEMIDWTMPYYAHDSAVLGLGKAVLQIGHFNFETFAMRHLPVVLSDLLPEEIPLIFAGTEDLYTCL